MPQEGIQARGSEDAAKRQGHKRSGRTALRRQRIGAVQLEEQGIGAIGIGEQPRAECGPLRGGTVAQAAERSGDGT
ncbi:MAG: hypothetical protein JNN12_13620 [Bacteroidetes Order II. Incertae sedis bacterium]|nr:hypothetical protein [Bacteroidetes Order II. bacterium]